MEAKILLGFILLFSFVSALTFLSRLSYQARKDRRDAERWRRLMMYRKDLDAADSIIRARFDEESA